MWPLRPPSAIYLRSDAADHTVHHRKRSKSPSVTSEVHAVGPEVFEIQIEHLSIRSAKNGQNGESPSSDCVCRPETRVALVGTKCSTDVKQACS